MQFHNHVSHSQVDEKLCEYSILNGNPWFESKHVAPWYLLINVVCALDGNKIILFLKQNNMPNKLV
jgi:hypothetical protein